MNLIIYVHYLKEKTHTQLTLGKFNGLGHGDHGPVGTPTAPPLFAVVLVFRAQFNPFGTILTSN